MGHSVWGLPVDTEVMSMLMVVSLNWLIVDWLSVTDVEWISMGMSMTVVIVLFNVVCHLLAITVDRATAATAVVRITTDISITIVVLLSWVEGLILLMVGLLVVWIIMVVASCVALHSILGVLMDVRGVIVLFI